jgi:uncharacterized oligopeptide transporter (OPT) family protein
VGVLLTVLERTRIGAYLPSPTAMAVSFFVPATTGIAIGLAALVWTWVRRSRSDGGEEFTSSVAAGGIAGESLMGIAIAVWVAVGALTLE